MGGIAISIRLLSDSPRGPFMTFVDQHNNNNNNSNNNNGESETSRVYHLDLDSTLAKLRRSLFLGHLDGPLFKKCVNSLGEMAVPKLPIAKIDSILKLNHHGKLSKTLVHSVRIFFSLLL